MATPADISGDDGDPRISNLDSQLNIHHPLTERKGPIKPHDRLLHDPDVQFEEYAYYASLTREEELANAKSDPGTVGIWNVIFPPKSGAGVKPLAIPEKPSSTADQESPQNARESDISEEKTDVAPKSKGTGWTSNTISEIEWTNASRAVRTATGAACFYLITTDVLGPFGLGFAVGTLGWGPGIGLFTVFAAMAGYSGYLIYICFMGLDSYAYPCKNYADLAFRIYGRVPRHISNFLQSIQLVFSVGSMVIVSGQALSQVSKFRLCYAICCLIWAIVGCLLGQVRTLQKFGVLANVAVFLNLLVMFVSMGVMAHSPPNYPISVIGSAGSVTNVTSITPVNGVYPPVIHYNGLPNPDSIIGSINGLMQAVYAYAGTMLFVEFMSEMRRPRDYLKAMWGAQFFVYVCYMVYGCYVYYFQGQYAYQVAYQGVSSYAWQVVGNMLAIVSGLIAAALYGNIGIKVLYRNFFQEFLHAPTLESSRGKLIFGIVVPIYWSIAFVVAAAIPDFFGLTNMIAAVCTLQFTYSFPPILAVGYLVQKNAMQEGEGFDPATGVVTLHDYGLKRFIRGFFAKAWYINVWHVLYAGGALAVSGLGAYAACMALMSAFQNPQINSFSCTSPLDLNAPSA